MCLDLFQAAKEFWGLTGLTHFPIAGMRFDML